MEDNIAVLLEKYWRGETSVDEEREIKAHFQSAPGLTPEALYFKTLTQEQHTKGNVSWKPPYMYRKLSVAASVSIGLLVALLVFKDAGRSRAYEVSDPQEAMEITKNAMMMISSGLTKGKTYSLELKKINKTKEQATKSKKIK